VNFRYSSKRITAWRGRQLAPDEVKLMDNIQEFGCHILNITEDAVTPGWTYSVGFYDVFHRPEIIVVGLKHQLAQSVLNSICSRFADGLVITEGLRQSELLGGVECEFRQLEARPELRKVVGYASWFYGDSEFPVFQCVYPDLRNNFPWEDGFDVSWRERQVQLFQSAGSQSRLEKDFWAAHDPNSSLYSWKFADPPHTQAFTTKRIASGEEPITYVTHDLDDGSWQFHGDSEPIAEDGCLVCLHHFIDQDPTIAELRDLPRGWVASRNSPSEPWIREVHPPEDE
jgi:hypothetical protein